MSEVFENGSVKFQSPELNGARPLLRRVVLNFHGIGDPHRPICSAERPYWLSPGEVRTVLEVAGEIEGRRSASFTFTFDDGNASDYEQAWPLLEEFGRSAEFFVLAGRIDQPGSLSRQQIAELACHGFRVGCHGYDHVNLANASPAVLDRELIDARKVIEDITGQPVDGFAMPFGVFDRRAVRAARAAGYQRIYTSSGGGTASPSGLVPRTSQKAGGRARWDIASMVRPGELIRSSVKDCLRRTYYGGWRP